MEKERTVKRMTEYITKQQAINVVNTAFGHIYDTDSETVSLVDLQNEIVMTIEQHTETAEDVVANGRVIEDNIERLPAADVAPVVHARWRYVGSNWECSCCLFPVPRKSSFYHWCPQCGARMDGED